MRHECSYVDLSTEITAARVAAYVSLAPTDASALSPDLNIIVWTEVLSVGLQSRSSQYASEE